jgi:superfamily II DNA or RNA helicase
LKLEDIKTNAQLRGLEGDKIVRIVSAESIGDDALNVFYVDPDGNPGSQMLFRSHESRIELAQSGRRWSLDAPGTEFKLALEAYRIQLAHLFDPMMAVNTSNVEPLPHQISAVYESLLPRQPLRFVLADDPGAGKTIMAGLFIRELLMRADARRILIVCPGALSEQWQDELNEKFDLHFEIFSREKQEHSVTGNYFDEQNQVLARLDQLSRNEDYQAKLKNTDWDLIIVDEAHKMSAHYYGQQVTETGRFKLGKLLGSITRHFLLMTATPHNGKEEDFQLFMSLLDGDRFYGKFREGAHQVDISDLMRRMVKEELLKFDGTPLFPERRAYTANYQLSELEAALYARVTDYVRNEMNRADNLDGKRKNTVGFALTLLQRRLASSPEAIYQSLKRRHKRLQTRLEEMQLVERGHRIAETLTSATLKDVPDDIDEAADELPSDEYEEWAEEVVDQATAAETIEELKLEIISLEELEAQAKTVVETGNDKKWDELSKLLQDAPEMRGPDHSRRKLIIFTEHRDTLAYLVDRISGLIGQSDAVVAIHGGVNRDDRRKIQEEFRNNPEVLILVATDAAGEGVNLQNANLMVNYDLPWNPNRLEQRFGRIHRIGQTEVCHLWNIVAVETREGAVFQRLLEKLEVERAALGGRVFDILGEAFDNVSLKDLLIEAIRYGDSRDVRNKMKQVIDGALDTLNLRKIIKRNALVEHHMAIEDLYAIKDDMEKAEARKLQPYFIRAFFTEAFSTLGGEMRDRGAGRYEIRHVPAMIRERDRVVGETRTPVLKKYERVCFEKQHVRPDRKSLADLLHPGHPLMHATTDLVLEAHRSKLNQGTVLVDPNDDGLEPRVLFMIDHSLSQDVSESNEATATVSRRLQFIEITEQGDPINAGWAPHLDLEPIDEYDLALVKDILDGPWLSKDLEQTALNHAAIHLAKNHYEEVQERREQQIDKIHAAVQERLVKEINYWSNRYIQLKIQVDAGKQPRMQPENAKRRHDELSARLEQRTKELQAMRRIVNKPPIVIGGALIIPQGFLAQQKGEATFSVDAEARSRIEEVAMQAVMDKESSFGHKTKDVSAEKCGWDITARPPAVNGVIPEDRHIEVKGRAKGQSTITVSRNEILYGLNQTDKFLLAIVIVDGNDFEGPFYIRAPFTLEPDIGVASVNYNLNELLSGSVEPEKTLPVSQ